MEHREQERRKLSHLNEIQCFKDVVFGMLPTLPGHLKSRNGNIFILGLL